VAIDDALPLKAVRRDAELKSFGGFESELAQKVSHPKKSI